LRAVTGWDVTADELRETAQRIVATKRQVNLLAGWTLAEDTLPDRFLNTPLPNDPEASLTWTLKDEIMGRGKVYYAKLARGKSMFLAPRIVPHFNAIWGVRKADEPRRLSRPARAVLKVLRGEWEMATSDLRAESGVKDRATFTRAMDELQAAMIVIPEAAYYLPKFTYIWTLGIARFPDQLRKRVSREVALREIARCFLSSAGLTIPGELARVTGLSRPDAGLGNRALVKEGFAASPSRGVYQLAAGQRASEDFRRGATESSEE